jgi:hypothetical protein
MLHEFGKLFRYAALEQQAEVPLVVGCGGNNTTGSWSQEPVGWLESPHGAFRANLLYRMTAPQSIAWSIPVYITLPRREWQGLTEEQVKEVVHNTVEKVTVSESILFRAVARAIEAKLKERNHE